MTIRGAGVYGGNVDFAGTENVSPAHCLAHVEKHHIPASPIEGFVVICRRCGRVGVPQEFQAAAEAIMARHNKIGGFERRG